MTTQTINIIGQNAIEFLHFENDAPSVRSGIIAEVVERTAGCFYVRFAGEERLIPIDRIRISAE